MDPNSAAAFYRITLFLTDLNHVLGAVIPLKDRPTFNYANSQNSSSSCRPTQRSRAWKRSRLPQLKPQLEGFKSQKTEKTCVFRQAPHCPHASEPEQEYLEGPHTDEPNQQYFGGPHANEPDQQYSERSYACEHDQQYFGREDYSERCSEGLDDGSYVDGDLAVNEDVASDYHSDSSENRELPSDPVPEPLDTTLQEAAPEIVQPDQQEPEFDMANYSATDVNRWARTLSAKQFIDRLNPSPMTIVNIPINGPNGRSLSTTKMNTSTTSLTTPTIPISTLLRLGMKTKLPTTPLIVVSQRSDDGDGLDHSHEVYLEDPRCNDVLNGDSNNFDGNGHNDDVYDDNGGYSDCEDGGAYSNGEDGDGYEHLDDGGGYEHFDDGGGSENFDDGDGYNITMREPGTKTSMMADMVLIITRLDLNFFFSNYPISPPDS
ncbi:hypothetical protein KEM48_006873 [Puccinia striiformis f. sp. tritici PST-130]|nr:hypothetical protein KEM48_006873 [Puccinia striiformis f. sp. tritici PST-130]